MAYEDSLTTYNKSGGDFFSEEIGVFPEEEMADLLARSLNGWVQRNGFWYFYVNNRRQTGWLLRGTSNWYFLHTTTGRMQTGWLLRGTSNWYFLNPPRGGSGHHSNRPEGVMLTEWVQTGGRWYFLNPISGQHAHRTGVPGGAMRTGRVVTTGFFDRSGERTSEGEVHDFNSNGAWQRQVNNDARHMTLWWPRGGQPTTINFQPFNFNSSWQPGMNSGINNWNNSTANVRFIPHNNSNNTVNALSRTWNSYGRIYMTRSTSNITEATTTRYQIELNSRTINSLINNNASWTRHNVISSVMAHELGHVVGLRDNPTGGTSSLMNGNRNRNTITRPTTFDIQSVNMLY